MPWRKLRERGFVLSPAPSLPIFQELSDTYLRSVTGTVLAIQREKHERFIQYLHVDMQQADKPAPVEQKLQCEKQILGCVEMVNAKHIAMLSLQLRKLLYNFLNAS